MKRWNIYNGLIDTDKHTPGKANIRGKNGAPLLGEGDHRLAGIGRSSNIVNSWTNSNYLPNKPEWWQYCLAGWDKLPKTMPPITEIARLSFSSCTSNNNNNKWTDSSSTDAQSLTQSPLSDIDSSSLCLCLLAPPFSPSLIKSDDFRLLLLLRQRCGVERVRRRQQKTHNN